MDAVARMLDGFIVKSNPLRLVDAFVAAADLAELGFDGVEPLSRDDPATTFRHSRAEQAKLAGQDAATAGLLAIEGLRDETSDDEAQRTRPFGNETWQALFSAPLRQRERTILSSGHTDGILKAAR